MMVRDASPGLRKPSRISESRREREFFRYSHSAAGLGEAHHSNGAQTSEDKALTAFAQLVCLRLGARRSMISLFDKKDQYIITEATRTLSLQHDNVHDENDGLYWGRGIVPRDTGICTHTIKKLKRDQGNSQFPAYNSALIVPDLTLDDRFREKPFVCGEPQARFYAGVPIITPSGLAIGSIACLDDSPRDGLSAPEVSFMQDVATTVMAHLEMLRAKAEHERGIGLVKGLSRFIEGKYTLHDEPQGKRPVRISNFQSALTSTSKDQGSPQRMQQRQAAETARLGASSRTHAFNTMSNEERIDNAYDKRSQHAEQTTTSNSKHRRSSSSSGSKGSLQASVAAPQPTSDELQEALLSKDVRATFGRAASIVQEAMDVSGVVFLDASIGRFGGLRSPNEDSTSSAGSDMNSSLTDSDKNVSPTGADTSAAFMKEGDTACRVLGASYETGKGQANVSHMSVSERYLKHLMRRFAYGKIWNFDEDGLASSDEISDSSSGGSAQIKDGKSEEPDRMATKNRRRRRGEDSKMIQQLFPGVRSLALMPMWDSGRERFFAGSVVWTYSPTRVLSFLEDINYLGAFCDVVMAEVGRLDAQTEARTKTSFISSISHELRSPLHGILGSVECLQDGDSTAHHDDLVSMIDTCGRSLLDIIDHLLEHSVATKASRQSKPKHARFSRRHMAFAKKATSGKALSRSISPEANSNLALLAEEVIDSALWATPNPSGARSIPLGQTGASPLKVVFEVEDDGLQENGWNFQFGAGAWRRIVINLITNSMKYTDKGGYVRVALSKRPPSLGDSKSGNEIVQLSVTDNGRGMSQEYLNSGLWKAFSQEDENSQGTGLGLSLVHSIVQEAGGKVEVRSQKGQGTTVTIALPLVRCTSIASKSEDITAPKVEKRFQGLTYDLAGFDGDEDAGKRSVQACEVLRSSLSKSCSNLGLQRRETQDGHEDGLADVYIASEAHALASARDAKGEPFRAATLGKPCIVLCHSAASSRALAKSGAPWLANATLVPQPLGPRKFLKALLWCLRRKTRMDQLASAGLPLYTLESSASPDNPQYILGLDAKHSSSTSLDGSLNSSDAQHAYLTPGTDTASAQPASATRTEYPFPTDAGVFQDIDRAPPLKRRQTGSPKSPPIPSGAPVSVLLVDDNTVNLQLLETFMKRGGHQYISATNGLEAFQAFEGAHHAAPVPTAKHASSANALSPTESPQSESPPTLVLMDITMPIMDGLESTRRIRSLERTLGVKPSTIIALTALASASARQEAYSSGVDLFLTKPVRLKELSKIMADLGR